METHCCFRRRMRSAMYCFFILVVFFSGGVVCEDCETFNFENGLEDFNNEGETCEGLDMWNFGKYSELPVDGFDPRSSVFATPLTTLSCMSSTIFEIKAGGTLEINLFLKPNVEMYQIVVMVLKYEEGNIDANVLTEYVILTEGWQSIKIPMTGIETYLGYVALMAIADRQQSLLLDSLRYFAPSFEEQCLIYPENGDTTSTTVTLTTPTESESSAFTSTTETQTFTSTETPTPSEISTPTTEYASTTPDSLNPTSSDAYTSTDLTSVPEYYTSTVGSEDTDTQDTTFTETNTESVKKTTESFKTTTESIKTTTESFKTTTEYFKTTRESFKTTTESFETTTESETTDDPSQEDKTPYSFWNAYTITMVTVLSLIIVFVIAFTFYRIGKGRIESNISPVILSESDDLPPSITVPRVTGVYSNPSRSNTFSV